MVDIKIEREKKTDYSLSFKNEDEVKISSKEKKELKDKFIEKYLIEESDLMKALKEISLSQMNRFYSLLEKLDNDKIKTFVEKQLERASASKEGEDFKTSENFYRYYRKNFLNLDEKERKIILELMIDFVRYYEGVKKIDKINKEEEN